MSNAAEQIPGPAPDQSDPQWPVKVYFGKHGGQLIMGYEEFMNMDMDDMCRKFWRPMTQMLRDMENASK